MVNAKGSTKKSNLDRFLHCTTPLVPPQSLPKAEIRKLNRLWHPWEREKVEYFRLSDLWDCYDEWSAYGASVPIHLANGESLVQYYVPYLSAIQIFTSHSSLIREESEDGESYLFSDSGSDESVSEEGLESNNGVLHLNDRLGYLYLQYFERSAPYTRVPLMDKINELAQRYPGLMSLRSVDLSPASWMSVAWYPIYHIPMGRTIKDLSTCFLTYHTLSSSFQGLHTLSLANVSLVYVRSGPSGPAFNSNHNGGLMLSHDTADMEPEENGGEKERMRKEGEDITLVPFGMATYKMQGDVWLSHNHDDQERLASLCSVADSWLKQLRVQHHDFNYFCTMSMTTPRG
ncbi:hypothetical protein IGI04_039333 [Brassica rapa subsp. trilocularis]|uniref:Uncharacterized protein n=1 Tax=Brassica rapa subsp. trilocularis TaxID=1813537 RepID=A0ABQ7KJJ1_BRACM|nr:hypothetical protein IGI04_039333 [Brassica rapa subsp. trilocularis]